MCQHRHTGKRCSSCPTQATSAPTSQPDALPITTNSDGSSTHRAAELEFNRPWDWIDTVARYWPAAIVLFYSLVCALCAHLSWPALSTLF